MNRPLDAIFFDIDDTLFSTSVFADKARRAAVDAMIGVGLNSDRDTCFKELSEVVQEFSSNYGSHFDKLIERLPSEASQGLNKEILVAAGVVAYHETKWRELKVYGDVYEVLRWLSSHDLVRGIISAGLGIKQAEKVIRLKIAEFLSPNAIFFTEQLGISKPNPKLYRRVTDKLHQLVRAMVGAPLPACRQHRVVATGQGQHGSLDNPSVRRCAQTYRTRHLPSRIDNLPIGEGCGTRGDFPDHRTRPG